MQANFNLHQNWVELTKLSKYSSEISDWMTNKYILVRQKNFSINYIIGNWTYDK